MKSAFAIEVDGVGLGVAIQDHEIFRFHAAQSALFQLERFIFVSLQDVIRAARRAHASRRQAASRYPDIEIPRRKALERWRGLH